MNDAEMRRNPVEQLAEEFLERFRRGERPALSEYTRDHPELADEIRELFPALVLLEEAAPLEAGQGGPCGQPTADGRVLERLGDYRIVREVGRGGMGIVFEAVQEALGRHVALKVLPYQAAAEPLRLQRFRREARSAARLHHTNIVPVFDVGEFGGVHYYAMQFIQGQSLDEVLQELRRLRASKATPASPGRPLSTTLAGSLLNGQFQNAEAANPSAAELTTLPPSAAVGNPGTPLSQPTRSEFSSDSDFHFYRSVARVGLQAAEALAYAHGQRVLHRDIKPSNLLLDLQGTAWITDFGLAKEEGDDLTREGDLVGTLRYMAPERFDARSDPRSDLYSLGATLYELLTLRPAFAETDRARLIQRITQEEPPHPRKLDPRVPRDLETIVLKAMAKEPDHRYQLAGEMAEDLRRFLADRPIRARRASVGERVWRWCRRNPAIACLTSLVAGLVLTVAILASVDALRLRRQLYLTEKAEDEATHRLFRSLVEQARASRLSRRVGQRYQSLETLAETARIARQLHLPEEAFRTLRNEAIACLSLPDLRVAREWRFLMTDISRFDFDEGITHYARSDARDGVSVRRVVDDGEVFRPPCPRGRVERPSLSPDKVEWPILSPDGQVLVIALARNLEVWRVGGQAPLIRVSDWSDPNCVFRPDSRQLAVGHANGSISVFDLETGDYVHRLAPIAGKSPQRLAFHPTKPQLALACGSEVLVRDVDTGNVRASFPLIPDAWPFVAWHPGGRILGAVGGDRVITLWDVPTGRRIASLEGHKDGGISFVFNHAGDRLASNGWEGICRIWDPRTGQLLFSTWASTGHVWVPHFSMDDRLLSSGWREGRLWLWEVAANQEYHTLVHDPSLGKRTYRSLTVHPDGSLLAVGTDDNGFGLWNLAPGGNFIWVPVPCTHPLFEPSGSLATASRAGSWRWPIRTDQRSPGVIQVGAPERLAVPASNFEIAVSRDGRVLAGVQQDRQAAVLHEGGLPRRVHLGSHNESRYLAISPDGRWVALGSHGCTGSAVEIWDAQSGKLVKQLPAALAARVAFSPDGHWLATSGKEGCRLWEVNHRWQEGLHVDAPGRAALAFSPDSRMLAVEVGHGHVLLLDPTTGQEYARLEDPNQDSAWGLTFSPDSTRLLTIGDRTAIHVWDLRAIRRQLTELGLDWDLPAYEPLPSRPESPRKIRLDQGALLAALHPKEAVAVHSLALALCPFNADAYWCRGRACGRLNEPRQAIADYSQALAWFAPDDPRRPEAHLRRASNFQRLGDHARALQDLRAFAEFDRDEAGVLRGGAAHVCNDAVRSVVAKPAPRCDRETTLIVTRKAVALAPDVPKYQTTLGMAYYRFGDYRPAIETLERNLGDNNKAPAIDLFFLAMCHARLGERLKARDYYDRAEQWVKARGDKLEKHWSKELKAFRAEADALLSTGAVP